MPTGVGGLDTEMSWGKEGWEEGLCDLAGIGQRKKGVWLTF